MSDEEHPAQSAANRYRVWTANPSEQWAYALDHMDGGEYDLAIQHCQGAVEIWPSYYDAWLLMAGAQDELGQSDDALTSAQRASEIAVYELSQAWNTLAALHLMREEYEEAITIDRVLTVINPARQAIISYRMAVAHSALDDLEAAERLLYDAIEQREDLADRALSEPLLEVHHAWIADWKLQHNPLKEDDSE